MIAPDLDPEAQLEALLDAKRAAFDASLISQLLDGPRRLDEVEVRQEIDIPPVDVSLRLGTDSKVRIERLRVLKRTFPNAAPGSDEYGYAYYEARGYGTPLTKKGEPSKSERASWYYLPDALSRRVFDGF